jgi:uncharacterized protein YecE (DUF72 family)
MPRETEARQCVILDLRFTISCPLGILNHKSKIQNRKSKMIYIGTSGFSYDDWVGPYYPEGLDKKDWLAFYAREFKALEINYTYYRLPHARALAGMARRVPADFRFTIKATQEMTHTRDADPALFQQFVDALKPLTDAQKFGAVLAQFPASFHNTRENVDYLKAFRERWRDLPLVIEFRNAQWLTDETFALLRDQQSGFCCVDEPRLKGLIPPVAEVTSNVHTGRTGRVDAQDSETESSCRDDVRVREQSFSRTGD